MEKLKQPKKLGWDLSLRRFSEQYNIFSNQLHIFRTDKFMRLYFAFISFIYPFYFVKYTILKN